MQYNLTYGETRAILSKSDCDTYTEPGPIAYPIKSNVLYNGLELFTICVSDGDDCSHEDSALIHSEADMVIFSDHGACIEQVPGMYYLGWFSKILSYDPLTYSYDVNSEAPTGPNSPGFYDYTVLTTDFLAPGQGTHNDRDWLFLAPFRSLISVQMYYTSPPYTVM